jgi:erythronate-4-phosphate dehydrogenase
LEDRIIDSLLESSNGSLFMAAPAKPVIVADENIVSVREAFQDIGDVRLLSGRAISREAVRDADLLLVRSITPVGRELLEGSRVRFVATATIGVDHLDMDWLNSAGIAVASAPGSNANSVAEWATAALLVVAGRQKRALAGLTAAVIGVGHVGALVAEKCESLGMTVLRNDPPLARETNDPVYRGLDQVLPIADVVTLHTPLTAEGIDKTHHLLDRSFIDRMKPGAILMNAGRGAVADSAALHDSLDRKKISALVLDVWEDEPSIDAALLARCALGTPHIAGYSLDGKIAGTRMIHQAACAFLGRAPSWKPGAYPVPVPSLDIDCRGRSAENAFRDAVLRVYPIESDDLRLRDLISLPSSKRGPHFDHLRKTYPIRREFRNTTLRLSGAEPALHATLRRLGFATR